MDKKKNTRRKRNFRGGRIFLKGTFISFLGFLLAASSCPRAFSDQAAAGQDQIDAALDAIDAIEPSSSFSGRKIMDGSLAYTLESVQLTSPVVPVDDEVLDDMMLVDPDTGLPHKGFLPSSSFAVPYGLPSSDVDVIRRNNRIGDSMGDLRGPLISPRLDMQTFSSTASSGSGTTPSGNNNEGAGQGSQDCK